MDNKETVKFIEWLGTNIKEFQNKSPKEIVEILNKLSYTEKGVKQVSEYINRYKENLKMFKNGGKVDYLVQKYANGSKYNRAEARQNKQDAGLYDEDGIRTKFEKGNLSAKIAKAKAVDGYENRNFITDFDREEYRRRKRELKQTNPEMTRRERKAEALTRHVDIPTINTFLTKKPTPKIDIPNFKFEDEIGPIPIPVKPTRKPRGVVEVGPIDWEILPENVPEESKTTAVSWNQFANEVFDHIRQNSANRSTQDNAAVQGYIWDQYQKYRENPNNYMYIPMTAADIATQRAKAINGRYSQKAIGLTPVRGTGYYDPNLHAVTFNTHQQALPESQWGEAARKGIAEPIMATIAATAGGDMIGRGAKDAVDVAKGAVQTVKNLPSNIHDYILDYAGKQKAYPRLRPPEFRYNLKPYRDALGKFAQRPAFEGYRDVRGKFTSPRQLAEKTPFGFYKEGGILDSETYFKKNK